MFPVSLKETVLSHLSDVEWAGGSAPGKNLGATRNWEGVMKLCAAAYYKFSELQASLLLVTEMYPNTG